MKLTKPQGALCKSTQELNLFMSGQGGGKTQCAGIISGYMISNFPHVRGLIAANTHDQLNRSTMFRIRSTWKEQGIKEYNYKTCPEGNYVVGVIPPPHFNTEFHEFGHYHNIISFANGKVIYIGSLENYKSLDGMEVGWAMLDETKDTREEALREVILGRLRQKGIYIKKYKKKNSNKVISRLTNEVTKEMLNPLYIFTSPAKVRWLNEFFCLDEWEPVIKSKIFSKQTFFNKKFADKKVVISSSYLNSDNLPPGYVQKHINNQPSHLIDMLVYGFPFSKAGGEFYKQFDREKHVGFTEYNPELPLYISFDENYVPYAPCGVWQIEELPNNRYRAFKIREIDLEEPKNSIYAVCNEVNNLYKEHTAGFLIYGDATSKKGDPKVKRVGEDKPNFYSIIKKELYKLKPKFKVPASNPAVVTRGQFMNAIFEGKVEDIEIVIGTQCKNTISDYTFLKEDDKGKKLKEIVVNKQTKQRYQKYGHDSDLDEYFICEAFKKQFKKFIKPEPGTRSKRPSIAMERFNKNNKI